MSTEKERILDEIHSNIREMRLEIKELHKEVIVLKTEKKIGITLLTLVVSTITTLLFKFVDVFK